MSTSKSKSLSPLCTMCRKNLRISTAHRCRKCQKRVNEQQKLARAKRRAAGLCICGAKPVIPGTLWCKKCQQTNLQSQNATVRRYRALGLCGCGDRPEIGSRTCQKCKVRRRERRARERLRVLNHYGCKCACPGCTVTTPEFLEIDHIDGNGGEHRRELGGIHIYSWLVKNNFPDGFQVLCCNCNRAKYRYAGCPHTKMTPAALRPGTVPV